MDKPSRTQQELEQSQAKSKVTENGLRQSEARFKSMFERHSAMMLLINPESGKIIDANEASIDFYGYSKSKLLSMNINQINMLTAQQIEEARDKAFCEEKTYFHFTHKIANGEEHVVEVHSTPIVVHGHKILFSIIHDITKRKEAEDSLRKLEAKQNAMISNIADVICIIDKNCIVKFISPNIEKIIGWQPQEVIGTDGFLMIHPDDLEYIQNEFDMIIQKDSSSSTMEFNHQCKDGSYKPVELTAANLLNDPAINGILLNYHEITKRRNAEKEQEKLQTQLTQSLKLESIGRLAGGVAHDFNNMLGVILGNADMIMEELDPAEPIYSDLEEIRKAAHRSADLTRQLLAFARKQTVKPKVLDLNDTVEGMLQMLRRLIGEDLQLVWQPGQHLGPVKIDPSQIDQMLANLCVNARDSIADVGKITIGTSLVVFDKDYCSDHKIVIPGEFVQLSVTDDGCGMDSETLAQIFEPFFTTKELGKGTGLGLATTYGIVKQNKGFIKVKSEPDLGTTFQIYLPLHSGNTNNTVEKGLVKSDRGDNETILLVEDEPAILRMTQKMLQGLGYTVVSALSPGEATQLAGEHEGHIDLLMTDVVMPEMNGRDLAKKILVSYPDIKRLFISGYTANVIAHHGVLNEGVHFLQKPFTLKELKAKVAKIMGKDD